MRTLPRVVCSIDGSTLPVQDYSFTSVVNGGPHEFRGQAPLRRLLALDASQEAPLTVYHEETGDILWDGRFVTDPEVIEGIGLISATGPKSELEKAHGRLLYQNRDVSSWTNGTDPPHNYYSGANPNIFQCSVRDGALFISINKDEAVSVNDENGFAFWAPGQEFQRYAYTMVRSQNPAQLDMRCYRATGPIGAVTFLVDHRLDGATVIDDLITTKEDLLLLGLRCNAAIAAVSPTFTVIIKDLRVNGIASGDIFYAHEVLQDLGGRAGLNTSLIENSGLNVLPLDWTSGSWASLADYMTALLDWRWLISTTATPGTGLIQYLEAGPWERKWTLWKGSHARPNLKPQQRRNEAIVTYRDLGGSDRHVRVRADPDPLLKYGVVRTIEETLSDVQPDSTLATAVATTYAQRYSQMRWVGDINAVDARDDAGRGDARLVKPGDIGRLADWGPSEETFHRIHGVEQTQTTVRYSIEAPISAAPLIEVAGLEMARRPSGAVLPELEPVEAAPSEPAPIPTTLDERLAAAGTRPGQHMHHGRLHRDAPFGGHMHHGQHHVHG